MSFPKTEKCNFVFCLNLMCMHNLPSLAELQHPGGSFPTALIYKSTLPSLLLQTNMNVGFMARPPHYVCHQPLHSTLPAKHFFTWCTTALTCALSLSEPLMEVMVLMEASERLSWNVRVYFHVLVCPFLFENTHVYCTVLFWPVSSSENNSQ